MGYDCGFDIHPRLDPTPSNQALYSAFLAELTSAYSHEYDSGSRDPDGRVLFIGSNKAIDPPATHDSYITLMMGECPTLPRYSKHCSYLLRFSSKVSGSLTMAAEPYIRAVTKIARKHFGDRVVFWHELRDSYGVCLWKEVAEAGEEIKKLLGEGDGAMGET